MQIYIILNNTYLKPPIRKGKIFMDKILLFIPMYNCEKQIVRVLEQLKGDIKDFISEVIIVNNCSTDSGEQVVIDIINKENYTFKIKLLRNDENYGLGGSHKVAFNYAIHNDFDYVIVFHGDDQGNIDDFYFILKNKEYCKYKAILGSRFMNKSKVVGYSKFRVFGNKVFNGVFSLFSKKIIYDLGAGLNMYKVDILRDKRFIKFSDDLTFNCYSLLDIVDKTDNYIFYPISWKEEDQVSNVKLYTQTIKTFKIILKFSLNKRKFFEDSYTSIVKYNFKIIKEI